MTAVSKYMYNSCLGKCPWSYNAGEESLDHPVTKGTVCPGPEDINPFSCSAQLSTKFVVVINLKLLTIANSFMLNLAEHENFSANEYENANYCWHFHIY